MKCCVVILFVLSFIKVVKKKGRKKTQRRHSAVDDEDYGSDMDLEKELYPMSHYMKNRRELIRQMFSSLSKQKLTSMLPDILKVNMASHQQEIGGFNGTSSHHTVRYYMTL